jgi:hypothetical protein
MRVNYRIRAGGAGFGGWIDFSIAALFTVFPEGTAPK